MLATHYLPSTTNIRLRLACEIAQVRPVVCSACEFLMAKGLSKDELISCELALAEACNNAVLYTKSSRQLDPVEIELSCDDSIIEMRVHDHTDGFDLPRNVELVGQERESGRGIFIMQSLMDDVVYLNGIGGNTLTLRKRRPSSSNNSSQISPGDSADLKTILAENEQIISEMAEELSSCYESLSAIFRNGAELGKTDNLQQFSRSLCEDLLQITSADWFLLRIVPKEKAALTAFVSSAPDLELPSISTFNSETNCAESKAAVARKDVWFNPQNPLEKNDPLQSFQRESVGLVHPFYFNEMLIGTLSIGKTSGQQSFTAAHVNVVHTFADFLAIQIINARLREEQLSNRLVTHELEIAQGIQRALLPKKLPRLREFGLAGFCASARHVGGDFYDVMRIDEHSALLTIADVMGKGVPAAMFAAILRSVLRGAPELATQPASLMSRVNRLLFEELSEVEMFITVQLAFVDVQAREIIVASAGHSPALLVSCETAAPKLISPEGMPLGILQDAVFSDTKERLPHNSRLLLYTDGLSEARDPAGQLFGNERLQNWMSQSGSIRTADELKDSLATELRNFQGHAAPSDDQTFIILAEET